MALAQWVEERNMKLKQEKYAPSPTNSRPTNQTISYPPRNQALPHFAIRATLLVESKGEVKREMQFKRLTKAEIMDKRARGLCYRCDEKYTPWHHCRQLDLQVLMVLNDGEEEDQTIIKGLEGT